MRGRNQQRHRLAQDDPFGLHDSGRTNVRPVGIHDKATGEPYGSDSEMTPGADFTPLLTEPSQIANVRRHTRPASEEPTPADANPTFFHVLTEHRIAAAQMREAHARLMDRLAMMETPGQMFPVGTLGIPAPSSPLLTNPVELRENVQKPTLSVGLLNPNSINVYWSTGGNTPSATGRAWATPPNALLVLPIAAQNIEIGCDPAALSGAYAAGVALPVFVIRFFTVQPAFLGKGA